MSNSITVFINDTPTTCVAHCHLSDFLLVHAVNTHGAAVAINKCIVSKAVWASTPLNHNDVVDIFSLVAGG
jgi:thiamine biosynthesis protein ThiS